MQWRILMQSVSSWRRGSLQWAPRPQAANSLTTLFINARPPVQSGSLWVSPANKRPHSSASPGFIRSENTTLCSRCVKITDLCSFLQASDGRAEADYLHCGWRGVFLSRRPRERVSDRESLSWNANEPLPGARTMPAQSARLTHPSAAIFLTRCFYILSLTQNTRCWQLWILNNHSVYVFLILCIRIVSPYWAVGSRVPSVRFHAFRKSWRFWLLHEVEIKCGPSSTGSGQGASGEPQTPPSSGRVGCKTSQVSRHRVESEGC